jgi:protein TonB
LNEKKSSKEFVPYDTPPELINGVKSLQDNLVYPEKAKEEGIEGTVLVQAKIALDGTVKEAEVLKGLPGTGLDEAALEAIKKTIWQPAKQRDKDVSVWITIPVEFRLNDKK